MYENVARRSRSCGHVSSSRGQLLPKGQIVINRFFNLCRKERTGGLERGA